jgi:hypothetical protein
MAEYRHDTGRDNRPIQSPVLPFSLHHVVKVLLVFGHGWRSARAAADGKRGRAALERRSWRAYDGDGNV